MKSSPEPRLVAFYLDDLGGFETLEVGSTTAVRDSKGSRSGFPRRGDESYSWYLCDCQVPPVASRAKDPSHFHCRNCERFPDTFVVCSCGVVSPAGDPAACLWCGTRPGFSHRCKATQRSVTVLSDHQACPLCHLVVSPRPAPPESPESPTAISRAPTEVVPEPLAPTEFAEHGDTNVTLFLNVTPSEPKGEPPTSAESLSVAGAEGHLPPTRSSPKGVVRGYGRATAGIVVTALAVAVALGWSLWHLMQGSPLREIRDDLKHGRITEPAGRCALDRYLALAKEKPNDADTTQAREELIGPLKSVARQQMNGLAKGEYSIRNFTQSKKVYDLLSQAEPSTTLWSSGQIYCDAHNYANSNNSAYAIESYNNLLRKQPHWFEVWEEIGQLYEKSTEILGKWNAERSYKKALVEAARAHYTFALPRANLAKLYASDGRNRMAAEEAQRALSLGSKDKDLQRIVNLPKESSSANEKQSK